MSIIRIKACRKSVLIGRQWNRFMRNQEKMFGRHNGTADSLIKVIGAAIHRSHSYAVAKGSDMQIVVIG